MANVEPQTSSESIPERARSSFKASVRAGYINLFKASEVHRIDNDPVSFPNQLVHVCPELSGKPIMPLKTPDLSKIGERDPFENFGAGEKVINLEVDRTTYSVVHNLHSLMEEHEMIVPTFPVNTKSMFRSQITDLNESDLKVCWDVTKIYAEAGREIICFFNGGPLAGASQPHLHVQYCPFQQSMPPSPELIARSLQCLDSKIPSLLPLPWVHFVLRIPSQVTSSQLFGLYQTLLNAREEYVATLPEQALPEDGPKRRSYNLFLTRSHMHLVPRRKRLIRFQKNSSDEVRISVNGLVIIGLWHVGDQDAYKSLRRYGLENALKECCYPRAILH